ncbi:heterokaryon incompatibility protein [Stagonosporopsis vannaccii]|nr:heterokaryon incompatibility protein [Stagonosporopsis vannaccii]
MLDSPPTQYCHQTPPPPPSIYHPLTVVRKEIRLLEIHPSHGAHDTLVHCTLSTHTLGDTLDYAALSYVWGDAGITRGVVVNGQTVQVTRNLAEALAQLRRAKGVLCLWADALCIDQSNAEEKGLQVQMMGAIYQSARAVLAWLGLPDEGSARGMRAMRELARVAESAGLVKVLVGRVGDVAREDKGELLESICGALLHASCGVGEGDIGRVIALMERAYWKRLWILQEISLAGSVTLICGDDSVSWVDARKALAVVKWLRHLAAQLPRAFQPFSSVLASLYTPYVLEDWRAPPAAGFSAYVRRDARLSLFDLLDQANDGTALQCSDPRDRVYALLGLLDSSYPFSKTVDYSAPYVGIFIRASVSMLKYHGPTVLLFAGLSVQEVQDAEHTLPSWAVDWRCTQRRAQEMWQFVPDTTRDFAMGVSDDGLEIAVLAASAAEVFAVVPCSHDLRHVVQQFHQLRHRLEQQADKPLPARRVETMLWRALIYTAATSALSDEEVSELFDAYLSSPSTAGRSSKESPLHSLGHRQATETPSDRKRTFEDLLWVQTPRVLFITTEGVIGSGPACTQVGDVVHATPGLEVPVLLRADRTCTDYERWKLVGAAFVDSMVTVDRTAEGFFTLDPFWSTDPETKEVVLG